MSDNSHNADTPNTAASEAGSRPVRVRFAPSPTGPLHPGGVRTALFNYLFARKHGGTNIIRIEDTDQNRYVEGAEQFIIDSLAWTGVTFDEGPHVEGPHQQKYGPYRQSERKAIYRQYAEQLVVSGNAYYAFDTPDELTEMRTRLEAQGIPNPQYNAITRSAMKNSLSLPSEDVERRMQAGEEYVIRFKIPRKEEVRLHDEIRGWVQVSTTQLDDKVLFKSDGMPTYHLANIVDDYLMEITHVIRGEEWLPSAPLHVLLYRAFGWEDVMPRFAHLPLLLRPDGKGKLSKRDGDKYGFPFYTIAWTNPETGDVSLGYREQGFLAPAYVNFLAFLGWNPGTTQEIFSMEELIEAFTIGRINKHGARYDYDKLKWFNHQYMRQLPDHDLMARILPRVEAHGWNTDPEYLRAVIELQKDRLQMVNDFETEAAYFFEAPTKFDGELMKKKASPAVISALTQAAANWDSLETWEGPAIEAAFQQGCQQADIAPGKVLQMLRMALTGVTGGPVLWEITPLLGCQESAQRLRTFAAKAETLQQE